MKIYRDGEPQSVSAVAQGHNTFIAGERSAPERDEPRDDQHQVQTICAWCNPTERHGPNTGRIPQSHAMCREHAMEMLAAVGLTVWQDGEIKRVALMK